MEVHEMKQISIFALLVFSLISLDVLAGSGHLDEAIKHSEQAASASDAKGVAQHAKEAKMHAQSAKDDKERKVDNKHVDEGISCLDTAVKEGDSGNADAAKKSAREALDHFKAAAK